jgi:hypothetical protein
VIFLLKYQQNLQETEQRKKEKKRKRKKEEEEKRAPRVSSNKGEVNILREEKYFNFKIFCFDVIPFSPPPS